MLLCLSGDVILCAGQRRGRQRQPFETMGGLASGFYSLAVSPYYISIHQHSLTYPSHACNGEQKINLVIVHDPITRFTNSFLPTAGQRVQSHPPCAVCEGSCSIEYTHFQRFRDKKAEMIQEVWRLR